MAATEGKSHTKGQLVGNQHAGIEAIMGLLYVSPPTCVRMPPLFHGRRKWRLLGSEFRDVMLLYAAQVGNGIRAGQPSSGTSVQLGADTHAS